MEIIYESKDKGYLICKEMKKGEEFISYRPHINYMHSCTYINKPLKDQVALTYTAPVLLRNVKNILILGAGAGENIRQLLEINNEYLITAVDIDPEVFEIAKKYFNVDDTKVNFICSDAYDFVRNCTEKFDYIIIDVYKKDSIPEQCISIDFFNSVYKILTDDGFFVMNTNFNNRFESIMGNNINILKQIQNRIFISGFNSIFHNDILNMGIQYVFKNKITINEFMKQLFIRYMNQDNKYLKSSIGAIILCTYVIERNINVIDENIKIETKRKYYSKKILNIIRYYNCNEQRINNSIDLENITLKYLNQQIKRCDNTNKDDIWYDFLNIDIYEYYHDCFKWISNQDNIDFDKIKKFISYPNQLNFDILKCDKSNNKINFLWNYIYALYLIKLDLGDEAIEPIDKAINYMCRENYIPNEF